MELYVTELSKYVITFLLTAYTILGFITFKYKGEKRRQGLYNAQNIFMFLMFIACFIQIEAKVGKIEYLFFFTVILVILFATIMLYHMIYPDGNRLIINNMCMLLMIGFIMITRLSYNKAVRQFLIAAVSLIIGFFIPNIIFKFEKAKEYGIIYAIVGILALGIVLIMGSATNGSKISYTFFGVTFQPSELVKILFVLFVAASLYKSSDIQHIMTTSALAAAHVIILVLSKDLGSALIFFVVYLGMVFIATRNVGYLAGGLLLGALASVVAYKLFTHIQVRVSAWLDPFSQIESGGYQISQSLFGISSGGWFGLGLFGGSPDSIPYVEADFIFSAIAEEFGIIFACVMILICISTFIMMMYEAYRIADKFYQLIGCGIAITYIFQVFLTIGGGTKFIPLTGVTLPFVSYGGTSVFTTVVLMSVFEGLTLIRFDEAYQDYLRKKQTERRQVTYEKSREQKRQ